MTTKKTTAAENEAGGRTESMPEYVIEALALDGVGPWLPQAPGDSVAGVFVSSGYAEIEQLDDPSETRMIPIVMLHGCTVTVDGELSDPQYFRVAGYFTVLANILNRGLAAAEPGTLVRITFLGERASAIKGHNDYKDFALAAGPTSAAAGVELFTDAPPIEVKTLGELEAAASEEPF